MLMFHQAKISSPVCECIITLFQLLEVKDD